MLMFLVVLTMLQFNWTPIPAFIILSIALPMGVVGVGSSFVNLLPFTLDQMMGETAEELSAAVQWYWWGFSAGILTQKSLECITIFSTTPLQVIIAVLGLALSTFSISTIILSDCLCHHWLDTHHKTNKPIRLIFRVLNYARKHNYPRQRSAFTYLDEEQPLRLDFGKDKFGGPFTEEEVEDVKTVLRLLPLFISIAGTTLCANSNGAFPLHIIPTTQRTHDCVAGLNPLTYNIIAVLLIPAYRFILYHVFYKRIPSMLRRVGMGLFLCLVSVLMNLTLDTVGHLHSNTSHCMFDTNTGSTDTLPVPLYWLLISDFVHGIAYVLVLCSSLEFIMAQTPNRMRGVMMGLAATVFGFGVMLHKGLDLLFQQFNTATPSCGFYYYLVLSLIFLLILVLFTILSKHYKLRERERHINIQAIAEEHYERYLDQEEEYMREMAHKYQKE